MKKLVTLSVVPLCLIAGQVAADCGVLRELSDRHYTLDRWVPVASRDRGFIQGYGMALEKNGLGSTYVIRDDLLRTLNASGCDPALRKWAIRKGRPRGGGGQDR